jgi:hypothetical protein
MIALLLFAAVFACVTQQQSTVEWQLDRRIGPPFPERYSAIRDSQEWLNPYLKLCGQGVILSVRSISSEERELEIRDLRQTLLDLPVAGWPYGRVVALQDCSLLDLGDEDASRQRMLEVESVIKSLQLEASRWPS